MNSNYVQRILFTLKIQGPPTLSLCIAHLFIYSIFYIYIYTYVQCTFEYKTKIYLNKIK